MKVAITGHSTGIGNALFTLINHKTNQEHQAIGFSRLNGFDLLDPKMQSRMFGEISQKGCSVFINNAYNGAMQIDLFKMAMNAWAHVPNRTIVNVISRAVYTGSPENPSYATWKRELQCISHQALYHGNPQCKIINIYPGLTDTNRVKNSSGIKLEADQVAELIWNAVISPVHIHELVFGANIINS